MDRTFATVVRFVSWCSSCAACCKFVATTAPNSTEFEAVLMSFFSKTTAGKPADCMFSRL